MFQGVDLLWDDPPRQWDAKDAILRQDDSTGAYSLK